MKHLKKVVCFIVFIYSRPFNNNAISNRGGNMSKISWLYRLYRHSYISIGIASAL